MKIKSIEICNHKSIGETDNKIIFDTDIIALIGKNESGKSNVLTAIKDIKFFSNALDTSFKTINRKTENPVKIIFDIEFSENDFRAIDLIVPKDSIKFTFSLHNKKYVQMEFSGSFQQAILNDTELMSLRDDFIQFVNKIRKENINNLDINNNTNLILHWLENIDSIYFHYNTKWFRENIANRTEEMKRKFPLFNDKLNMYFSKFRTIMPAVFYYKEEDLLVNSYVLKEVLEQKLLEGDNILNKFIKALDLTNDKFEKCITEQDAGRKEGYRRSFEENFEKLTDEFNNFYKSETVHTRIRFENETCSFFIRTGGGADLPLSERSDGLRWYFNFFIALQSAKIQKSALVLIDEPAIRLHINAQREVLRLFGKIAESGLQIIYTTHSPYMIDSNSLERVRPIIKNNDITSIHKNCYHPIDSVNISKMETLTPIIHALGCNLKFNLGPSSLRCNLVVEGITDYFYLKTMFHFLGYSEDMIPYLLPCAGVDNISKVVTILYGWGLEFKVLLDNDKAGQREYRTLHKILIDEIGSKVFYVEDGNDSSTSITIENLLAQEDISKLVNSDKTLRAREFMIKVSNGEFIPSQETIDKFTALFLKMDFKSEEKVL